MERMPEIGSNRKVPENNFRFEKMKEIASEEKVFEGLLFKNEIRLNKKTISFNEYKIRVEKPLYIKENLIEFNLFDLENDRRNRRIDRFIEEQIDRPLPGVMPPIRVAEPQAPVLPHIAARYFCSLTGFTATSHGRDFPSAMTVKGKKVVSEGNKPGYTEIHFTPGDRSSFSQSKMTDSLAQGIQGVMEMIEAVDKGKFELAQLFVGVTNINMALIAQRMGFAITDECRTPDGKIDINRRTYTVVGKLEDIRAKVEEFKKKGTAAKLRQRSQRLRSAMIPQVVR